MTTIDPEALDVPAEAVGNPPLAILIYDQDESADGEMAAAVAWLSAAGWRLAGVVQANIDRPDRRRCDMRLTDLATGEETLISQDLGDESEGCRLDLDAFTRATHLVERSLEGGADLLIVNRFGKQEAQGRGFVPAIATALERGVPVIAAVSRTNLAACEAFLGGGQTRLPIRRQAIIDWRLGIGPRTPG